MVAPSPHPAPPDPPPRAPRPGQRLPAEYTALGFWGLLIGGWSSLMAVMADSGGDLRIRAMALLVLISVVVYLILQPYDRWSAALTGTITGVLVGLILGWLVARSVVFFGPTSVVPLGLAVTAVATFTGQVRSIRHASAVISETVAELALTHPSGPGSDPDWRRRL